MRSPQRPDDWPRIQELFHAAVDLPPEEQREFLDAACLDEPSVREEVESLLRCDTAEDPAITHALEVTAQAVVDSDPLIGSQLGPWRIVREIGSGGMGTVYLAVRDDDFLQRAAVKLVRAGMDSAELLDRFRDERQILANLDHPFIARLIDGGSSPDRRPYLVMEYVEGQPIDAWCRESSLSLEDRCRLFVKVCEAVSHAHRNLVVHRDLKPGNILITSEGLPKLLDFGIAKLLVPDRETPLDVTAVHRRPITPQYASPELVMGKPVTTSCDIYSLGAILYELLSGTKALHLSTRAGVERLTSEAEITRPSAVIAEQAGAARLRRKLSGDLDNIVLMAMRREPERRYSSVEQLAGDLQAYLDGRPVLARKDSYTYRCGKFVRKHVVALSLVTLAVASMAAGTFMAVSQARRAQAARLLADSERRAAYAALATAQREHDAAQRERDVAVRESARAESEAHRAGERLSQIVGLANHSLFDIHSQIERLPGATDARRHIVQTTLQYLRELSKDAEKDEPLRRALVAAYLKLGDVQGYPYGPSLGDRAGALESYQAGADLLAGLHKARPRDADVLSSWIDLQRRIALVKTGIGRADEGLALLESLVPDAALLARLRPGEPAPAAAPALIYSSMSLALDTRGRTESAAYAQRALHEFEELTARFPGHEPLLEGLAEAHCRMGVQLNSAAALRAAEKEFAQCAEVRERLAASHPNDMVRLRDLMLAYGHTASVLGNPLVPNLGDSEGARAYYRKAVALAQQMTKADPQNQTAQFDLAGSTLRLGIVPVAADQLNDSLAALRETERLLETMLRASPRDARVRSQLMIAQEYIGHRLRALGRNEEAAQSLRKSVSAAEAVLASDAANRAAVSQLVASSGGLAGVLAATGARAEALARARATIEVTQSYAARFPGERLYAMYVAKSWLALADAHRVFSELRESQAAARRALDAVSAVRRPGADALFSEIEAEAERLAQGTR